MAEFRRGFHTIDRNNTGKITMEDLRAYMHRMNYKESFVVKWMKLFKPNEEGVITYENYCNTLGLIPRRPESVASDISEATFPETPHIEPHSSTEDSETTHANNAVTGVTEVFDQHAVEATVSQTQTVPGDVGEFFAPKECRLQKKTKKSPRDPKHKLSSASKSLLSSDLTDTSKELEFEHGECASLSEPESVDLSHVPAMPSQLDIGMLLDRPSETSSSTKAQAEFPGDAALEFRQPFSSDPQVHTTFADDPVDIPIFSEREESTFTNVVKSSKRKRSTSKSKEKRKQRLRGARSESDKNSTEEISTVETPSVTEFLSQLVNQNPVHSDPQVHTTFADDPVDIPIFSEREESTFTNVVKSSKRKRSTSKSKEKRKQRLRVARSESDKNSTEEISTVETPSVTEFPSQLVNQNSGTLESAELYVSCQLPVFQIPDMPTIPDDVTAEHNGVEKRETDHQSRDIFGEEQSTEEQSKGGKEKREHEDEVPPTAPDNGNITYEDNLFFESARSAELGPENMNIADVAMISSECEYVIDQSVTNLGENEIVGNAVEPNGAEKTKPAVDLKQTKDKAKQKGKHRADGSRSASESENLQSDKLPPEAASTTAISVEFEPMSTDHITTVQVESEKAEFARPKSPADVSSDVYHISSDIPPESNDTSEAEQTISAIPKGHKSKQLKVKSKEKGKKKGEVLLSASESERSRDGEILTALPVTEDMEKQKKTEPFESTEDVPPLLTGSTLGDVSLDRGSSSHPEELNFLKTPGTEQKISKQKHRKTTKSKESNDQNEEVPRTTPDSESFGLEEVMDLPAIDKETGQTSTELLEFAEPITFSNESLTSVTSSGVVSDHKAKRKRKVKNKGEILLSASETEKSGPEDVSAITGPLVSNQRLADVEMEQETTACLELAETPFPRYGSPTDLNLDTHTSRDGIVSDSIFPCPELGDTNEWKYPKTKGKRKPKQTKAHTSLESEEREIPASPILMELRPDVGDSHTTAQFEFIEGLASIHQPSNQPIPAITEHTEDFFKLESSESSKATSIEQKRPTIKRGGLKGERNEEHTENIPRTVHESEPGPSEGPSSVAAPLMTEMELGVMDVPQDHKKPRARKRSRSVPKQHPQQEEICLSQDSESLMAPRMEAEIVETEPSGKSEKTKVQKREYKNGSAIISKSKKDKAKIIQPPANVKTDTSSQLSAEFSVSETQQGGEAYPGEKGSKSGTKRKRKTDQSSHIETDSRSKAPKTKPSKAHEDSGPSVQGGAITGTASTVNNESVSALKDATQESVCSSCRPVTTPKDINPDALFSRIPFWMRIRKKQSVIRRRRVMRKIDMKRKREAHREQLTDDASTQMVTHRFPRSFETQPNPEKSKSQVRKRRRAVERLVKYRADQVNRVQRPKTKKKAKRRLTALDRWKVRSSLRKRGVIVILLGGRHRGKRVVSLGRQKSTGLLLVTGPFRYNGCPLRRVHPNMVLATETRVDLGKFKVPLRVHSKEYFARKKLDKKHNLDVQLGLSGTSDSVESKRFVPNEERKEDQRIIDEEVCKCIKAHADSRMLIKYLRSLFSLSKHDKPHAMQF
ncbi:hypothetical protein T265_05325 [Opisthorchis viverrini]|uniref:Large ribosomal subunit protein eL6 n=1 Tax=Opisthorchis viverrini TaxID=6198 RepID=A0A074ZK60_OPIVI|nr:hypothetical protein T265_05325 [Opisthorchis viverrini]KER27698.1 hypothetical protein T265_05325 [Opisthorchis viverrini]